MKSSSLLISMYSNLQGKAIWIKLKNGVVRQNLAFRAVGGRPYSITLRQMGTSQFWNIFQISGFKV